MAKNDAIDAIERGLGIQEKSNQLMEKANRQLSDLIPALSRETDKLFSSMEKSLTFATGEMNKIYKNATSSPEAIFKKAQQLLIDERDDVDKVIKEASKKIEEYSKSNLKDEDKRQKLAYARETLNNAKLYQEKLNSIKSEDALRLQVFNNVKKQALNLITSVANGMVGIYQEAMSNAYNNLSSTWESTYSKNLSQGYYDKAGYNAIIDGLQSFIKQNNLTESISINDYMQEIQSIVSTGASGDLAAILSKWSVLSKEGGVSVDFADIDFQKSMFRMFKEEGSDAVEAVLERITIESKAVGEAAGNNFNFVNGGLTTMISSLSKLSSIAHMTSDSVNESATALTALAGVTGETDFDPSAIIQDIYSYAEKGIASGEAQKLLAQFGTSEDFKKRLETEGIGFAIEKLMGQYYDYYNKGSSEWISIASESLGSSENAANIESLFNSYGSKDEFLNAYRDLIKVGKGADTQEYFDRLEELQTNQQKLQNSSENTMMNLVQLGKNTNILIEKGVDSIVSAISNLTLFGSTALLSGQNINTLKALFMGGKGDNAASGLQNIGGTQFKTNANGNLQFFNANHRWQNVSNASNSAELQQLYNSGSAPSSTLLSKLSGGKFSTIAQGFSNGTAFSGTKLGGIGKVAYSTLGKATLATGGLVMLGKDAIAGYKNGGVSGAVKGALTGVTGNLNSGWDVFKAGAKNTAKGALIGSAFGPVGTAVGGAIGAIAGFGTALAEYNDPINVATREMKKMAEATKESRKATQEFNKNLKKTESLKKVSEDLKVGEKPLAEITKKYPELNKYLDKNGNVTQEYINKLNKSIELEEELNKIKYYQVIREREADDKTTSANKSGALSDLEKEYEKKQKILDTTLEKYNLTKGANTGNVKAITNEEGTVTGIQVGETTFNYDDIVKTHGKTIADSLVDFASKASNSNNSDKERQYAVNQLVSALGATSEQVESAKEEANTAKGAYIGGLDEGLAWVKARNKEFFDLGIDDVLSGSKTFGESEFVNAYNTDPTATKRGSLRNIMYEYNNILKILLENKKISDDEKSKYYAPSKIAEAMKRSGIAKTSWYNAPAFATGLDYVPYDNFFAILHKGEKVMTAADVNIEKANIAAQEQKDAMVDALQNPLLTATNSIIDILQKIYLKMGGTNTAPSNTTEVDYSYPAYNN